MPLTEPVISGVRDEMICQQLLPERTESVKGRAQRPRFLILSVKGQWFGQKIGIVTVKFGFIVVERDFYRGSCYALLGECASVEVIYSRNLPGGIFIRETGKETISRIFARHKE